MQGDSTEYNMAHSQKRAEMVWRYLKEHGIKGNLKEPVGYGSAYLIVLSGDLVQQAPNRRVEILCVFTQQLNSVCIKRSLLLV